VLVAVQFYKSSKIPSSSSVDLLLCNKLFARACETDRVEDIKSVGQGCDTGTEPLSNSR
jgi:hypothetical protein